MYKLISWYNINRKKIWAILIASIIIIAIIYYLINMVTEQNITSNEIENKNDINNNLNSVTLSTQKSVVSGNDASNRIDKLKIIDNFVEYCNSQNVEEAYNLISDECKEEMYPELENFKKNYYDQVFGGIKRDVSIENWFGNTYKVDYNEDFLSTGKYNKENTIQDYITIVKDSNSEYKLNINKYVKRTNSSSTSENNDVKINVNEINTYMDYEIYKFEVINNSDKTIQLGNLNEEYSMYLKDKNDVKYPAYLHELTNAELMLSPRQTKYVKIKYYNKYSSSKQIKYAVFSNVILDYEAEVTENTSIYINL